MSHLPLSRFPPFRRAALAAMLVAALLRPPALTAQEAPVALPEALDASVARATEYLAKQQNPDGSFGGGEYKVAVSGLSVMAFLACGHTPGAGRYGLVVRGGVDFLLAQSQPDGYYGKTHDKGMYDQGIVTLALAEAYGVEPDEGRRQRMHAELTKAVKVILDAQAI